MGKITAKKRRVFSSYKDWLKGDITEFQLDLFINSEPSTSSSQGRPSKPFLECSKKTKKRKVQDLLRASSEELTYAAGLKLYSSGNIG